jgi:translation initiation factor IF-2
VEGTFLKSAGLFRVVRGGEVLHEVKELTSLQHFKKKVESVKKGDECGMSFEGFADIAVGDKIQTVVVKKKAQKLDVDWS